MHTPPITCRAVAQKLETQNAHYCCPWHSTVAGPPLSVPFIRSRQCASPVIVCGAESSRQKLHSAPCSPVSADRWYRLSHSPSSAAYSLLLRSVLRLCKITTLTLPFLRGYFKFRRSGTATLSMSWLSIIR